MWVEESYSFVGSFQNALVCDNLEHGVQHAVLEVNRSGIVRLEAIEPLIYSLQTVPRDVLSILNVKSIL